MTKQTTTDVALNDMKEMQLKDTNALLQLIRKQIEAITGAKKKSNISDKDILPSTNEEIGKVTDIAKLIAVNAGIKISKKAFEQELKDLKATGKFKLVKLPKEYTISGIKSSEWCEKIESRIVEISQTEKLAKLRAAEAEFAEFETETSKFENAKNNLANLLNVD